MTEEFNLNNPNNLNPIIPNPWPGIINKNLPKKEKLIEDWNKKPEVKKENIEAIDKEKYHKIEKRKLKLLEVVAVIGVLAILIIAGCVGYSVYVDGSIVPKIFSNVTCEGQIVNVDKGICPSCPSLPTIPACPACPSNNIKLYCGNETE